MIRLGLRLTLAGGKESAARLVATAAGVALGVGMLLITLAGINAVDAQNARAAWITSGAPGSPAEAGEAPAGAPDPLLWLLQADRFDGETVGRVDVAATGADSPVPPGIPRLPGPGQFYASPALADLLATTPAGELGDRFPGHQVGTIASSALPGPDSLLAVVGHDAGELSRHPGATEVTHIRTAAPDRCDGPCADVGIDAEGLDLILAVVAGALLFPVLIFIGTASRLGAAGREQRFAAIRLVGATPRQVSVISAVESTVAALAGVAGGFGVFALLRPALATVPFTGARFYVGDLSLRPVDVLLVTIGVPLAAAAAARVALHRVRISPLGASRRVTPPPPRAYRTIPLVVGVAELAYFAAFGRPETTDAQIRAFGLGFLLILAGLVSAGPWLTMVGSRVMARRTRRPATLIAGRRLSDNPNAGFRAISGLVLALFVGSATLGVITTIVANRGAPSGGAVAQETLFADLSDRRQGEQDAALRPFPEALLSELAAIPGVEGVTTVHADPSAAPPPVDDPGRVTGLASCAQLARTPALGRCAAGADVVAISPWMMDADVDAVWPAAEAAPEDLAGLPAYTATVATDGSTSAIERARTTLSTARPDLHPPATIGEMDAAQTRTLAAWQQLANVVILASLVIAGCSLTVSVAAGLNDRKRPFGLLRLTGVPLGVLRRVVALESAVPLLVSATVSTAMGFLAAHLFVRSQLDYSLEPPGAGYYAVVVAGLVGSLAVIASGFPLLARITGPEAVRNA